MSIEIKVMDKQQLAEAAKCSIAIYLVLGLLEGYHVVSIEPSGQLKILEGPIFDQQYAIHRAVNVHGMEAPAGFNPSAGGDGLL